MVLYFTGTGNSRYIAEKVASNLWDSLFCINDAIKSGDHLPVIASDRLVFVLPTYAWRIPRIVEHWILETEFKGAVDVWFVMNCGDEIGNASKYNRRLSHKKNWNYRGTMQINMPENYIAMFDVPSEKAADTIIQAAETGIAIATDCIINNSNLADNKVNFADCLKSDIVNPVFYRYLVNDKKFRVNSECKSCGKCEKICPLNNISLESDIPKWGHHCTHCMACISYCPTEAIEYGKASVGKRRYHL